MTQQSLITRLKAVEEALKESNFWLKGSLLCKEFHWDYDQRKCAEGASEYSDAALSDLRELIKEAEGQTPVVVVPIFQSILDYAPGDWFVAQSVDEMEAFYWASLPAIRAAAKECGYAVAVHGSTRRDFDLIAMPWRDGAADKNDLAHAMQKAACGLTLEVAYSWEQKPAGRVATSFPICTTAWHDMISAGHVDLSIITAAAEQQLAKEKKE